MKYDFDLELTSNNSLALIFAQLKKESTVLELGPANGRLTKYMKEELNCDVYLVELEEAAGRQALQYGKDLVVGDIENYEWIDRYRNIKFDYIVCADVLEHLRDPEKVLTKAKQLLKPEGTVLLSVPNFAHNSVMINLLQNRFEYTPTGLLDNTHVHMFTKESLERTLTGAGLVVSKRMATYSKVGENEIPCSTEDVEGIDKSFWLSREYGEVYQFVYAAQKGTEYLEEQVSNITKQNANYFAQLFWGRNGVTEDISTRMYLKEFKDAQRLCFSDIEHNGTVRFDPLNAPCIVRIESIVAKTGDSIRSLSIKGSNAKEKKNNIYMFTTKDPVMEIGIEGTEHIDSLEIVLKYISLNESQICMISDCVHQAIRESDARVQNWQQEVEELQGEVKNLQQEIKNLQQDVDAYRNLYAQKDHVLEQILNSKRWKIISLFRRSK